MRRPLTSGGSRAAQRRFAIAIIFAVTGFVAYAIYGQAAQGHQLDAQVAALRQQNTALQQRIADHQREIVEAQTAAWLIEEARKLGYVFPGEKIFVIPSPGASPPAGGGVNAPLPAYSPLPTPSPSTGAAPSGSPQPAAAPTPYPVTLPTPSPH
jgi:cell division protein FtsB